MADNVGYTAGTGTTIAADDVGGVLFQRVKVTTGADGTATDVSAANPMPVSAASLPLPTGAATEATLDNIRDNFVGYREAHSASVHSLPALVSEESSGDLVTLKVDDNGALKVQLGTGAATETTLSALNDKIENTPSGALLVGTSRDRFFENFATFDTVNDWEVVQTGTGMSITGPLGGAVAGSGPYLNISSGTTASQKTIILSRASFKLPVDLRYQITASQRIANNRCIVGFVQVDDTGAIVTATSITTAPDVLNARNAAVHQHDGTVATTSQLRVRAAGAALDTFANAFGTGFTTVATGSSPNFLSATTYALTMECDKILSRALGQNVLTNTGGQFTYDRTLVNPSVLYKMVIIIENLATPPASSTNWRFHLVNVLDATRFDVSPRNSGSTDLSKAFPVIGNVNATCSGTVTANIGSAGLVVYTDSSTNLGSAGVFTGTSRDAGSTPAYNYFIANAQANQAGTIRIEKSTDNTTWRRASKDIAVAANAPEEVTVKVTSRYNRVVYTNGGTSQTEFLLTSAYHRV
jgi:hypothetical protein